jgi:hypothetical protein
VSDTPRTDAAIAASDGQWSFTLRDFAQEMERELASKDARTDEIYKVYRAALDLALRAPGERNDARAELAAWEHEAKRLEAEAREP